MASRHLDQLYAAFNGGFKATHGQYGMLLEGVEYLPPRDIACTFACLEDGTYRIATWSKLKDPPAPFRYYRAKIKSTVPGSHGVATLVGIAKP